MTVKELIEMLRDYPEDADVEVSVAYSGYTAAPDRPYLREDGELLILETRYG